MPKVAAFMAMRPPYNGISSAAAPVPENRSSFSTAYSNSPEKRESLFGPMVEQAILDRETRPF